MKTFFTPCLRGSVAFIFLLASCQAFCANVTFEWNPNAENTLAGYMLFVGTTPGTYQLVSLVPASTNRCAVTKTAGTYYAAVAAQDTNGLVSAVSNEVGFTVFPPVTSTFAHNTLSWKAAPGAKDYRISYGPDANLASGYFLTKTLSFNGSVLPRRSYLTVAARDTNNIVGTRSTIYRTK